MSNDLSTIVLDQRNSFMSVAVDKNINFDREAGFALQVLGASEYLGKVALANKASLVAAVNNVAAIGITLNPAQKLAYLVPRKGAICLDISYMGLMHLAQVSGAIQWGQAVIVRKNDTFELRGVDKEPVHTYSPFGDRGEMIGCYVVVKTDKGDYLTEAMSKSQIDDIKVRSDAWKAYVEDNKKKCPWVTDYEEMAKKTVVKRAAKYWPRRERLDKAVHYLNTEAEEGIVFDQPSRPQLAGKTQAEDLKGWEDLPGVTSGQKITGRAIAEEALAAMDEDEQIWLRDIADEMRVLMAKGDFAGAVQHGNDQRMTNDEQIAFSALFDSKERSGLAKAARELSAKSNVTQGKEV